MLCGVEELVQVDGEKRSKLKEIYATFIYVLITQP